MNSISIDPFHQVKSRDQELRKKEQNYRDERAKIGYQMQQRQTIEEKIKNKNIKIAELQTSSINLDEEKEKCIQKSNHVAQKSTEYLKKMYSVYINLAEKENDKNQATLKKIGLSLEVSDAEERLQSSSHELHEAQESLESHSDQIKRQREHARQLLEEAKKACGLDRDNLPNNYKTLFKRSVNVFYLKSLKIPYRNNINTMSLTVQNIVFTCHERHLY